MFDNNVLEEVHDLYTKIRKNLGMIKTERIDSKQYPYYRQPLNKFTIWTPIDGDNDDWVDPKGYLKKFPLSISKLQIKKFFK